MGVFDVLSKVTGGGETSDGQPDDATDDGEAKAGAVADPDDLEPGKFQKGAEMLAGRSDVPELDFTEESLADLDAIATGNHPVDDPIVYGSYLGETLVREFDGEWVRDDGWAVEVYLGRDSTTVAVFDAARMALERGPVFEQVAQRLHEQGDPSATADDAVEEAEDGETAADDESESDATGADPEAASVDETDESEDATSVGNEDGTSDAESSESTPDDRLADHETPIQADDEGSADTETGDGDSGSGDEELAPDSPLAAADSEPAEAADDDTAAEAAGVGDEPVDAETPIVKEDDASDDEDDAADDEDPSEDADDSPSDVQDDDGRGADRSDGDAIGHEDDDAVTPSETETDEESSEDVADDGEMSETAETDDRPPADEPSRTTRSSTDTVDLERGSGASTGSVGLDELDEDGGDSETAVTDDPTPSITEPAAGEDEDTDDGTATAVGDGEAAVEEETDAAETPVDALDAEPVDAGDAGDGDAVERGPVEPVAGPTEDEPDDEAAEEGKEDSNPQPISEQIADIGPSVRRASSTDAEAETAEAEDEATDTEDEVTDGPDDGTGGPTGDVDDGATEADDDPGAEIGGPGVDDDGDGGEPVQGDREPAEPDADAADAEPGTHETIVDDSEPEAPSEIADDTETAPADDEPVSIPSRSDYEAAALEFSESWADREFDYSLPSLARLDSFLDDQWDGRFRPGSLDDSSTDPAESSAPLVQVGAYAGEVLVQHYDGEWVAGDGGEPAVAVSGRHGRRETFPVFAATRRSLIHPARLAYEVDALANRLDVEPAASGAEETGFAIGEGGPGTAASSADVITTLLDRAEAFVQDWPEYDLDYRPASLARLDNLVDRELDTAPFPDATLGDWTDPDALRLADTAAGIGAYYAAVLVRHLDAQWEIDDEVALAIEGPAGQTREVPFEIAVDGLRGRGKLMLYYDRVYDAVEVESRTAE